MKANPDYPIYSIGIMSELLDISTETIRLWERSGVIPHPKRRGGKRFYSERELKRLQFVRNLSQEGLSVRAIIYYLRHYPCWQEVNCPGYVHNSNKIVSLKPCWQEDGTYCQIAKAENPCASCSTKVKLRRHVMKENVPEKTNAHSISLADRDLTTVQIKFR